MESGDEGADGAMPPEFFGPEPPLTETNAQPSSR